MSSPSSSWNRARERERVDGEIVLHQELPDGVSQVTLRRGEAVINRPGVWHTADVTEPASAVFITAGVGTEMRPR